MSTTNTQKNKVFSRETIRTYLPILALAFVVILFAILSHGWTVRVSNIMQILLQSCTYIVAGLGIIFTMSLGNMDMSLDGIVCMASVMGLWAAEATQSWVMFPVIILLCVGCELFIGGINILLGINSVIVSFAISFLGKGVTGYFMNRRTAGLSLPSVFSFLYNRSFFYSLTVICIVVIVVIFHYTKAGKYAMFIGSNPTAARAAGINVTRYKMLAYLIAGIMMSLAVMLTVLRAGSAGATSGSGFHVTLLLMMVIGGASLTGGTKEKVFNVVVGVLLFLFLENGLTVLGVDPNMTGLIEGIIFLASVTLTFDRESVPYIL